MSFNKPGTALRRVQIAEIAYVGNASTIVTWLLNFALRKASGKHLRDDLPRVGEKNGKTRSKSDDGFAEMTPRGNDSPSSDGTPASGRRRFIRFGVGSLKAAFVVSGVEITTRSKADINTEDGLQKQSSDLGRAKMTNTKKKAMTRGKWRLMKGIASFVDITVVSLTVREEDDDDVDMLFCDKLTFEASGTAGASLKFLITARMLRGKDGWSMTDTNVNLVAEFDSETKTIVPVHAGLSGSTLSLVKRVGERAKKIETKTDLAPITVKQQQGPHKAVRGLLKVPRKCKIEFKRVVMENKNQEAPLTGVMTHMQFSVERVSASKKGFRLFRKQQQVVSPFASTAFEADAWAEVNMSVADAKLVHGKHQTLALINAPSASVFLSLSEKALGDGGKLPATATFTVDSCDFRHHADAADLVAALKAQKTKSRNGSTKSTNTKKNSAPWDVVDAQMMCKTSLCARMYDEHGATSCQFLTEQIRGRYGNLVDEGTCMLVSSSASDKRGVCTMSRVQVTVPGYHPVVQIEAISVARSEAAGNAVELSETTIDLNMNEAGELAKKIDAVAKRAKATMASAKGDSSDKATSSNKVKKSTRVILVDTAMRARCTMTPYSTFGEIPQNSRGDEPVECALDISCPLAEMSQPEANLTRMAAGGFTVSMYDTIQRPAKAEEAKKDSRWVGRVNYEEVAVENNRVMLVGSLDVEYKQGANKRAAVSVEGVEFDWEPDAHFLALEISNLAKAAKPAKMSTDGTQNASKDQTKLDLSFDVRKVSGSFFVTPGACAQVSFGLMDARPLEKTCCVRDVTFGMNGYTITELELISVTQDECERTLPHVAAITHEDAEDIARRRKFQIVVEKAKLMLPANLDLGDAMVAMIIGEAVFSDVVKTTGKRAKKERISLAANLPACAESSPSKPATEINVKVSSIEIEVEDSNDLERFMRAKQAALGSCIAAAEFTSSTEEAMRSITTTYLQHKEFLANGGGSALHMDIGSVTSTAVWGGGKGDGDELTAKAGAHVRRVDAPYSDSVSLQMQNVLTMHTSVTEMRVCVADLTARPIFMCSEATIAGTFVQARQYAPRILTGQVALPVGRRRWAKTNGPDTPSRPTAMWYTDATFDIKEADIFVATCIEPYLFNVSRELTTRLVLPRLHKHIPGGGGGRPPTKEYDRNNPRPPSMPWWDILRSQWRGLMRITMIQSGAKVDSQGQIEHLGAHGGDSFASELEIFADMWEFDMKPRNVVIRSANFTISRIQDDEECTEASTPRADEPSPKHKLVIFPVMCVKADYEFKALLDGGDGHRTHYRHDSTTGKELYSRDLTRSSACFVNLDVDLASMEEFVTKMVNAATMDRFVEYVRNLTTDVPSFEHQGHYSNPTIALTPDDVEFMKQWEHGMKKPMVALRSIWNLRPWGAPRRVKHPESISLVDLFASIDTVITSSVIHVVNASSDETANAYGACFCLKSVHCVAKKAPRTKVEFTLRADSSQFHVPERDGSLERKGSSPRRLANLRAGSITNRLNFAELDDVVKEMLQGSAKSPSQADDGSASRPTSTDPTLVLDTKRLEITQRNEDSVASQGIQIEVDAPRILIEAEQRNAILGWINAIWTAAQTERREPTWTELNRILKSADKLSGVSRRRRELDDIMGDGPSLHALSAEETLEKNYESPKRATEAVVLFVIQITAPQINFKGKDAAGRMLLAAEGGLVVGRRIDDGGSTGRRLVTVSLQQVQAYVAPTNVDLNAGVQWLRENHSSVDGIHTSLVRDDVFESGDGRKESGSLLRRIFAPGSMVFEHANAVTATQSRITDAELYAYNEPTEADVQAFGKRTASETKGEAVSQFSMRSPEIVAEMNSSQYVVLIDVMASLFLTPAALERPRPSFQASKVLMSRDRTLSDTVALESSAIVAKPMMKLMAARWAVESMEKNYRRAVALAPSEKQKVLREIDVLWSAAQKAELRVLAAVHQAEENDRLYRRHSAIRLSLEIEHAAWTLWQGGSPFISAQLSRLSLSRERQVDSSGMLRFKLHGLSMVSLDEGCVDQMFSRWIPPGSVHESRARNDAPLIDFFSIRAGSAPEKPVYDHLELSVQPFEVDIKHSQYKMIYQYLFPMTKSSDHDAFENVYRRPALAKNAEMSPRESLIRAQSINAKGVHLTPLELPSEMSASKHRRRWRWNEEKDEVLEEFEDVHAKKGEKGIDHKTVLLRYFRIHPLHMKMTYEGKSRAFRDLQLGVDAFAYENFSGRWRDLTSELKNHIVWSVLKSLVGFRGKFVESKIDDTQSIFMRVAERLKKTANLLPKPKPETSSGAEHDSESETAVDDRIKSQTSQAELFRTGWNDVDVDIEVPRGDGRKAPSRRFSRKKKKPRRIRPIKNTKKFLATVGIGSYTPSGAEGTPSLRSRTEVIDAWSTPNL